MARTTPIGLARYARDYFDSALAADDVLGTREGYEIHAPMPVMFLVAHSIELIIKAYLLHVGMSLDDMKKISHNLLACWEVAVENGIEQHFNLTNDEIDILNIISDLHKSTELRYIQSGFKTVPVFGPLEELTRKLLDNICPLVGFR